MTLVKLSSKGQLVLPKQIRAALGIEPGTILAYLQREEPAASRVKAILKEAATHHVALDTLRRH